MALSAAERKFMEAGRAAGYSDDELVAKVKERRNSGEGSPYKPTNYAAEAAKLPSRAGEYAALMARDKDMTPEQAVDSVIHTDRVVAGRTPEQRRRDEDVYANDPLATMVLAGVLGAGAGSLVGGATRPILAGAVNSATQTAVTGGDLEDIGKNALIGATIPAAGRVAKGIGNRIRGSEGGQARALWEKHGGNVGPLDSGSGVEEIAGLEPSRANVGRASIRGARNIRKGLTDQFEERTARPYREAISRVEAEPGGAVPAAVEAEATTPLPRETNADVYHGDLAGVRQRIAERGLPGIDVVDTAAEQSARLPAAEQLRDASALRGKIADRLYDPETPRHIRGVLKTELDDLDAMRAPDGQVMVTEKWLDKTRRRLQQMADYGIPTGPGQGSIKDRAFKDIAKTARELVDEGPYGEANAIYSKGMRELGTDREAIGLKAKPGKNVAVEDRRVAQILRNRNNDSEAAGAMSDPEAIAAFMERHPEFARQVDLPDLVRAKGKLEFGLDPGKTHNLIQMSEHPTVFKKYLDLIGHNLDAVTGRLLYRPAGGAQAIGGVAQSGEVNQILAALAAQRELEKRRAEALGR